MSSGHLWTEEQFNCPVCLDLPSDPTTIPCGHSYCLDCIADHWDTEGEKTGSYSCPECRQTFSPRPQLCRNTMLAEAVEQLRRGNLSSAARESIRDARKAAATASASKHEGKAASERLPTSAVPCDRCQEPRAAVKTCLVCMASFCQKHLKPHQTQEKLKKHELIVPTGQLAHKMCPEHKYLLEFYCRSCQTYICWLCTSNQHKSHESVSTQTERTEKQKTITTVQMENQQRLQDRERELKDMKKVLETLKHSWDAVQNDSEMVLNELQESVQRMSELIRDVMLSSGEERLGETQGLVDKLEAEVKQLKQKDNELKDLIKCQDHIHFLKTYQCLCSAEVSELGSVMVNPEATFKPVLSTITDFREKVENMCNQELDKINKTVFNTTPFTVTERSGQKAGILKLFSGRGAKPASGRSQGPPALPSVSVRGSGTAARTQLRNQNQTQVDRATRPSAPRSSQTRDEREQADSWSLSSQRQRDRQRRDDQEQETQNSRRPPNRQSRNSNDEQADSWSLRSLRIQPRQRREEREEADTWSLSSTRSRHSRDDRDTANGDVHSSQRAQQTPADQRTSRQQPERQSDRWSLSSLLPRNRKKQQESVRQATPTSNLKAESFSPQDWGNPTEVNLGLFLDSPTADAALTTAFPTFREIDIDSIQAPEPRTRDEFLQYACELTLDPSTAHRRLVLSEGGTKATLQAGVQPYPDSAQRFDGWMQVLSLQPLSSPRCYWEVEWRGRGSCVGVACGSMPRKGADAGAGLGYNDQSWSLELSDMCCAALHGNHKCEIPVGFCPRLGLFLDREAGTLSFYGVDDGLAPLHTFRSSFRLPLFAAFGVGSGMGVGLDFALGQFNTTSDSIKICPL